jgi:hypothetical protein
MRIAVLLAACALIALAVPASASPSSSDPCDPHTGPFNECGFNCEPGKYQYVCENAVKLGACVFLTINGDKC